MGLKEEFLAGKADSKKNPLVSLIVVLVLGAAVLGYIYHKPSPPAALTAEDKAQLKTQVPKVGMTKDQVKFSKWGAPHAVSKSTTSNGVSETWQYPYGEVYFQNGIATEVDERN